MLQKMKREMGSNMTNSAGDSWSSDRELEPFISNEDSEIFHWIVLTGLCQFIAMSGIVTNIINIICFMKQGFGDPVTISLLGLSVSDIFCLTTSVWINICFTPAFSQADLPFDPVQVSVITGGISHTTFSRVTGWVTALIAMERCLCVTAPLQVRNIITPKRVSIIIMCVSVCLILSVTPVFTIYKLGSNFVPSKNSSIIGLVFAGNRETVERISFPINNVLVPLSADVLIITCTIALLLNLQKKTEWRRKNTSESKSSASSRSLKTTKMVVVLSVFFIVCYVPISTVFMSMSLDRNFSVDGKNFKEAWGFLWNA